MEFSDEELIRIIEEGYPDVYCEVCGQLVCQTCGYCLNLECKNCLCVELRRSLGFQDGVLPEVWDEFLRGRKAEASSTI